MRRSSCILEHILMRFPIWCLRCHMSLHIKFELSRWHSDILFTFTYTHTNKPKIEQHPKNKKKLYFCDKWPVKCKNLSEHWFGTLNFSWMRSFLVCIRTSPTEVVVNKYVFVLFLGIMFLLSDPKLFLYF